MTHETDFPLAKTSCPVSSFLNWWVTRTDTLSASERAYHGRVALLYARPASEQLRGVSLLIR